MLEKLINALLGWRWYRVQFTYKVNGNPVFKITKSLSVEYASIIDDHRALKKYLGPVNNFAKLDKQLLSNGTLEVEPLCYLGRWKQVQS